MRPTGLPIDAALPALRAALAASANVVLVAPPGAGKSTVVPLALQAEGWLQKRRILMLEPRRLATRAVAQRLAQTLGESVGATVGYRMRFDTRVSASTRIEVVTEGVLTRMLQSDAALEGVGAVIFDEFHERSLQADLGLALCLEVQSTLRPELRLLCMSATLDVERVAALLGHAPVVRADGRAFDVATRYAGRAAPILPTPDGAFERGFAGLIARAIDEEAGDVLAFLPGAREIRRVAEALQSQLTTGVRVLPLYGDLEQSLQDAALAASAPGSRRVVLATNIAETSLTIPGIRIVVDSGLVRRARFDPATGMSRLETLRVSRSSAEQRRGRAGRVASGVCYRYWSEEHDRTLAAHTPPEILESDLSPLVLELAGWGAQDAGRLAWLDPPPVAMLAAGRDLLASLGALDVAGKITPHGRALLALPTHPRLAQLLLTAVANNVVELGADLAALLSERDVLRGIADASLDIGSRLALLRRGARDSRLDAVRRNAAQMRRLAVRQEAGAPAQSTEHACIGVLCAAAWPDRIGQRRGAAGQARYLLANGRGAVLARSDPLGNAEYIVALDLSDSDREAKILLGTPVTKAALEELFAGRIVSEESVRWDAAAEAVLARRQRRLAALLLEDKPLQDLDGEAASSAMLAGIKALGLGSLPWTAELRQWQARVRFAGDLTGSAADGWPDCSDEALCADLDVWLAPWLTNCTRRAHLAKLDLTGALRARLTHSQSQLLDRLAPTDILLPTGTRAAIDYLDANAPCASMRMQEVFGLANTPAIGGGRVPVTFKLLSPARRPLQITRDLASFWRNAYSEVRKDMRGQYPKHYWPENPLLALPVRGTRRKQ
jgi:ATP-dependent helicase HrpB